MLAFGTAMSSPKSVPCKRESKWRNDLQGPLSMDSYNQKFKCFKCAQPIRRAMLKFQSAHFLGEPRAPLFHPAGQQPTLTVRRHDSNVLRL